MSDEPVHQLGVAAAAEAIRDGVLTAEAYANRLLDRAQAHRHLNAFITIDGDRVLEAAREADSLRGSADSAADSSAAVCDRLPGLYLLRRARTARTHQS